MSISFLYGKYAAHRGRHMLEIDNSKNGGVLELKVGDSFELRLPENPTTGYRWQLIASGAPTVQLQEDTFHPPMHGSIGMGGSRCWRFRGDQEGEAILEWTHGRPWEKQSGSAFKVTVHVGPKQNEPKP